MLASLAASALALFPAYPQGSISVERFDTNPLLSVTNVSRDTALNLDRPGPASPFISFAGPSVIRVPDWIDSAPGQYAMYFAHHKGGHIRAAFADDVRGPWHVHAPGSGVLRLAEIEHLVSDHIASPDVHVDHARRRLVMYFHGPREGALFDQRTFLAESDDAVQFKVISDEDLGEPYFRVFWHRGYAYTPGRLGPFVRSRDGITNFETGPNLFDTRTRHYACVPWNDTLYVFYSRKNEAPERIRLRTIQLDDPTAPGLGRDWSAWALSDPREVLAPVEPYERQPGPRTLDPALFFDVDGRAYLFYSGGHEQSIAGAEIFIDDWQELGIRNIRCASGSKVGLAADHATTGAQPWLASEARILSLPPDLEGSKIIQTSWRDARSSAASARFLRFEVSRAATVAVAHDTDTLGRPAWLEPFTETGARLIVQHPRAGASGPSPTRSLRVYERGVEPGEVSLGGNLPRDSAYELDGVSYVVMLRERR